MHESQKQSYTLEPANFSDYRDFLKSRFDRLKENNKDFSLQYFAKKSQLSKSLLQFLFKKERHISLDKLPLLSQSLKLTDEEEYFVYLMVCKNSSNNPFIEAHFEKILSRLRHEYVEISTKEPSRSNTNDKSLYLNQLFLVLQTLVRLENFREDPQWIRKHLLIKNITEDQISATLKELEKTGFVYRDATGKLLAKPESLWRLDPLDPKGQNVFKKGAGFTAELMQDSELFKPSVYMVMSLAMDEERLKAAEKYMIEVHHKLVALAAESKNPNAVVHVGNFFLTIARLPALPR